MPGPFSLTPYILQAHVAIVRAWTGNSNPDDQAGGPIFIARRTVPAKEKPRIWTSRLSGLRFLQNLLVLNRKLQYPALAANPSSGVET